MSSISSGGPSPRGDEKKKGDGKEGGSKIRRKGKFLRKRKGLVIVGVVVGCGCFFCFLYVDTKHCALEWSSKSFFLIFFSVLFFVIEKTLKEGDLEAFALVHSLDSSSFETDTFVYNGKR